MHTTPGFRHPRALTATLLSVAVACSGRGETTRRSKADSVAVVRVVHAIIDGNNHRDAAAAVANYSGDARLFPPGEAAVVGLANIRPRYDRAFSERQPSLTTAIDELTVTGDEAVVIGRNTGSMKRIVPPLDSSTVNDLYVMLLRRDGGTWKIRRLVWHNAGPR